MRPVAFPDSGTTSIPLRWDIFCAVVDNYGDIGVCWRLARQLAQDHGFAVRLWVDDPASFAHLCRLADATAAAQTIAGVEVRRWDAEFPGDVEPADVVIEAFACDLPAAYLAAMAARARKPVWINLEYLSAEPWVESCHAKASPHPQLPLIKHFFFPGFTLATGGLLRERGLLARRDDFAAGPNAPAEFWRAAGFALPSPGALCVSLFGYRNADVHELLRVFATGGGQVVCALPEGPMLQQAAGFFGLAAMQVGDEARSGALVLRALPFVDQTQFDELLWSCDINFVRGEDSFVRAQWAGRPLVWQIYPQEEGAHLVKLNAFLARYCEGLAPDAATAVKELWLAWNEGGALGRAWSAYVAHLPALRAHARRWALELASQPDLAGRLAGFCNDQL